MLYSKKEKYTIIKYRYYDVEDYAQNSYNANEETLGLTFSMVFLNSLTLPITMEYIYNDAEFIEESSSFRFILGSNF